MAREEWVWEALRYVMDPELGINIVDLGLVYRAEVEGGRVRVEMTMTTPACPVGPYLRDLAEAAIRENGMGVESVDVRLVWDPPWHPGMMSEESRRQLGVAG